MKRRGSFERIRRMTRQGRRREKQLFLITQSFSTFPVFHSLSLSLFLFLPVKDDNHEDELRVRDMTRISARRGGGEEKKCESK